MVFKAQRVDCDEDQGVMVVELDTGPDQLVPTALVDRLSCFGIGSRS